MLNNPVLGPHYRYIEAKRLFESGGKKARDLSAATDLIRDEIVKSSAEMKKMTHLVKQAPAEQALVKEIAQTLKKIAWSKQVDDEVKTEIDALSGKESQIKEITSQYSKRLFVNGLVFPASSISP